MTSAGRFDHRLLVFARTVLFGLTRPNLGLHFPSDVLAGAALGTVVAPAWPPRKQDGGQCR